MKDFGCFLKRAVYPKGWEEDAAQNVAGSRGALHSL